MDRSNKPSAIGVGASIPQPTVNVHDNTVQATLPTGESVTVHLYGATVTSWKLANGKEQLFVSEKAHLDGSKPIRGGIPVVFPVFGPPPSNHATSSLPQHGFARNSNWEFLGKSSSESLGKDRKEGDDAVKLDFGLSHPMLSEEFQKTWPYQFGLVYSVTLTKEGLETSLQVQNKGQQNFEFQVLLHTYLSIEDISQVRVKNLQSKEYVDKTQGGSTQTEASAAVEIDKETDRVYKALDPKVPIEVTTVSDDKPLFSITREALTDVVVWNPWVEKAKGMADFGPDEAYKNMICVEAGSVAGWQTLEAGESWEGGQTIRPRL
ncbi:D-hexose-6-phosphate mutarotase [Aspergillus homomorphus CBS 101889]|uniref:Glucose-6-phosphate 1-epimerase n=1 Tax=Aspergillus homomorphus (strain CBS 101889) TaxID=1450537 RepID=A0A395I734_ASPHC|nr:galactose mutarotase-like protein [Aspergillus homomorphus CBS 101889]RAL16022.1 galactose mutarotase-like protein [Aspergillus homomorphus CBS 101889]